MEAIFYLADMLDVELTVRSNQFAGVADHNLDVGPFQIPARLVVVGDAYEKESVSAFVAVSPEGSMTTAKLWLYPVVTKDKTILYVIDGPKAGLDSKTIKNYGGTGWVATVKKFIEAKAIIGVFQYDGLRYNRVEKSPAKEA